MIPLSGLDFDSRISCAGASKLDSGCIVHWRAQVDFSMMRSAKTRNDR